MVVQMECMREAMQRGSNQMFHVKRRMAEDPAAEGRAVSVGTGVVVVVVVVVVDAGVLI